ncbi:MAG: RodZ domain-containing protein [Alphaproteobacteria bacterium]
MNATTPAQTEEFDATELGAMMREMRENLGHDLEKVAEDLRIRLVYLEAIETGRLGDLPGNAYVSGFLRAYSDYLGLDGEEIVRRFKMAGAEISNKTQLHLPSPVEEGRLPTALILLVAAVIAAGAYGGWYYLSSQDGDPMETVAKLPSELSGLVEGAANQTAPSPAQAQPDAPAETRPATESPQTENEPATTSESDTASAEATTVEAEVAETVQNNTPGGEAPAEAATATAAESAQTSTDAPAPVQTETTEATNTSEPQDRTEASAASEPAQTAAMPTEPQQPATPEVTTPASNVATAAETPAPAPEPAAVADQTPAPSQTAAVTPAATPEQPVSRILPGDTPGVVRIVVRATADSYVAVRTADNEPLFSQLMRPGDSYEVPSGADLVLETGNAGGLQITVGGKRVPSLGPTGQVRRNIPLDAERLLSGTN